MRLHSYINEKSMGPEDLWQRITEKCKPYLRDWLPIVKKDKKLVSLYRGMRSTKSFGEKKVRTNRRPTDSDKKLHKLVDDALYDKFNIKGRSQTIFCTGNTTTANAFGEVFMIFPVGPYEILWSEKVRDLYISASTKFGYTWDEVMDGKITQHIRANKYRDTPAERKRTKKILLQQNLDASQKIMNTYKKGDLEGAIKSSSEIMVSCERYIYAASSYKYDYGTDFEEIIVK